MKVVCFDLGGVLVRITLNIAEAAKRARVSLPNGLHANTSFPDLPCFLRYQAGQMGTSEYGFELSAVLGVSVCQAFAIHNHIPIEPYPGTLELIQELNTVVLTACLSNTNELHWQEMLTSGRFQNVQALKLPVASHELGMEKPHAEIFEAFEQLAEARGEDIVFFDDSIVNVEAGNAFGWVAHWINPAGDPAAQMRAFL